VSFTFLIVYLQKYEKKNKMNQTRKIRQNERELIAFLLEKLNLNVADYPINEEVFEYEGGKMGSISMNNNPDAYAGDLIQVEYIDTDNTPVMITLTHDTERQLLDLDFWKTDFSKLLKYPLVGEIVFK
jgi:citrate lyase synthetase